MAPDSQQDLPSRIGPYDVVRLLGSGGMGRVFLGQGADGRQVAVKVVHADLARDPDFRQRLGREAEATRKVAGPHIAAVVDADVEADPPWLATEYVPAPSLWEVVKESGPLSSEAVRELGVALAGALASVHAAGMVHRDVKPPNILMADAGPKLIDFGIARDSAYSTMTRTGFILGTPHAMAPEQIHGRRGQVGPPADVFALGGVLAFAATGRLAFGDGDPTALSYRIVHAEPDLEGLPAGLRALVVRCLAKDPGERPSAGDVAGALAAGVAGMDTHFAGGGGSPGVIDSGGTDSPGVTGASETSSGSSRRKASRLIAVACGVVAVTVATLVALAESGDTGPSTVHTDSSIPGVAVGVSTGTSTPTLAATLTPSPSSLASTPAPGPATPTSISGSVSSSATSPTTPPPRSSSVTATTSSAAHPTTRPATTSAPPVTTASNPPATTNPTPVCATSTPCRAAVQDGSAKILHSNFNNAGYCLALGADLNGKAAGGPGTDCSGVSYTWRVWRGTATGTLQLESLQTPGQCLTDVGPYGADDVVACSATDASQWFTQSGGGYAELKAFSNSASCLNVDTPYGLVVADMGPCAAGNGWQIK